MKKIDTYLPVFTGFYNTLFEPDETNEIECINDERERLRLSPITHEDCRFNYEDYENEVAEKACEYILSELKDIVSDIIFQRVVSPKCYNFSNDSINIEISLSEANEVKIMEILNENIEDFEEYIKDKYTSCSGFISRHSNDYTDWLKPECLEHNHMLGSILDFICELKGIYAEQMSYYTREVYLSCENYDELTTKPDENNCER